MQTISSYFSHICPDNENSYKASNTQTTVAQLQANTQRAEPLFWMNLLRKWLSDSLVSKSISVFEWLGWLNDSMTHSWEQSLALFPNEITILNKVFESLSDKTCHLTPPTGVRCIMKSNWKCITNVQLSH